MTDHKQKALNALAKGAGVTAIGMMVSKALTYLFRVSIARFLGPNAYGQISLAMMVLGVAGTVSYLAVGQGLKKFIPEYRTSNNEAAIKGLVLGALQLTVPTSILIASITFLSSEFIATTLFETPAITPLIQIISFAIITATLTNTFFDTTIGYNKIIYKTGTVRVLKNLVQLTVTITLLFLGFDVISAAWGILAGSTVSAVLGFYFLERKVGPVLTSKTKAKYDRKKLLRFSSPLLLSGIIGTVMGWADTALLGYYMTDFEVGLYNAALPTAMLILLPHSAIGSLAVSSFSELKERDEESIESSLQTATYWVFSLVLPAFLIMLLFSEQVLNLLFGPVYTHASVALSILAGGYLVDALMGRVGSLLQSKGHTKYLLYNNVAALGLNLGLNIVLIPLYGIMGAAVATASSTILTNLLMFVEVWRKEGVISVPFRKAGKIIVIGLIPLALIIGLDKILFVDTPFWFLFFGGIIYFGLYAVLFLKILGLGEEEREIFLRIGEIIGFRDEVEDILERAEKLL